jgi:DNA-binding transcriptional regulator PaaX
MVTPEEFHERFPLSLMEAVYTVSIAWHGWKPIDPELPAPTVKGTKPFLHFTGATDSAIRTAFSRARKNGELVFETDAAGTERFDMPPFGLDLNRFYRGGPPESDGLTLAVFRFSSEQDKERYVLKEILKNYGFQMLTQNVYVTGKIPLEPLEATVEREGLAGSLFLFVQPDYPEGKTLGRIAEIFRAGEWSRKIGHFLTDLEHYLSGASDPEDSFNRGLFAGAAHHLHFKIHTPPLPASVFPGKTASIEAEQVLYKYFVDNWTGHRAVYLKYHGGST